MRRATLRRGTVFWIASALATLHSGLRAVFSGPREKRVVWDIPREQVGTPGNSPT